MCTESPLEILLTGKGFWVSQLPKMGVYVMAYSRSPIRHGLLELRFLEDMV
jgi:hypothetical protein